jgi:hypothetical protein
MSESNLKVKLSCKVGKSSKHVRPRMTTEARDALNEMCDYVQSKHPHIKDRSDLITYAAKSYTGLLVENLKLIDDKLLLKKSCDDASVKYESSLKLLENQELNTKLWKRMHDSEAKAHSFTYRCVWVSIAINFVLLWFLI